MCVVVKTRCFYSFTVNSQSKRKKFLSHLPRRIRYEIWCVWFKVIMKAIFTTWSFFIVLQSVFLKNKQTNKQKISKRCLKIAWHSTRQKKNIEKEKEKKMRKSQTTINIFLFLLFCSKNLYFVRKYIWKNLLYFVTFLLQFLCVASCWKFSNIDIDMQWSCRRHTSTHNT